MKHLNEWETVRSLDQLESLSAVMSRNTTTLIMALQVAAEISSEIGYQEFSKALSRNEQLLHILRNFRKTSLPLMLNLSSAKSTEPGSVKSYLSLSPTAPSKKKSTSSLKRMHKPGKTHPWRKSALPTGRQ